MKAVIQRVDSAEVKVDGVSIGRGEKGLLVLLGVTADDNDANVLLLAKKVADLRIFTDENDKMNLSVLDVGGSVLTVSNFTLCADTKKGNRPSFSNAMKPDEANRLYELFVSELKNLGIKRAETGSFGADMNISADLNGPVTIILDTDIWSKK